VRRTLIIAAAIATPFATPAAACGFDGMFGFNHYADAGADAAAAEAMREAAIAEARDKFMARYGITEASDTAADANVDVAAVSPGGAKGNTPQ
jgi:hypothetical protein